MRIQTVAKNAGILLTIKLALLSVCAFASEKAPPLLDKHSVGIYSATPWRTPGNDKYPDDFYARTKNFDFTIRSVAYSKKTNLKILPAALQAINNELASAQQFTPVKAMILRIDFWDDNERSRLSGKLQDLSEYEKRVDYVLEKIDLKNPSLIGISLSEENMPGTNGRFAILSGLYAHIHEKFPGVAVYQWLIPNVSIPEVKGFGLLPADGWIIDAYTLSPGAYPDARFHLGNDPYATILEKYLATGKPVVDVIWASTLQSYLFDPSAARNTLHVDMAKIMEHQFKTNQEHNVPTAFYWMKAINEAEDTPVFTVDPKDSLLSQINQKVMSFTQQAHAQ